MKRIMKLIRNLNNKNQLIIPLGIFLVGAFFIWFAGTHLKFGQHTPFASSHRRFIVIMLMLVATAIYAAVKARKSDNFSFQNLLLGWGKIAAIKPALKSKFASRFGGKLKLSELPWFLVIGPANSGKTTLIENSQVGFLAKENIAKESIDEIIANGDCQWWVTPDAVLLDVPSDYHQTAALWQNLFAKKIRASNNIAGVIVALPLTELSDPESRARLVDQLKQRMRDLTEKFGANLPFYFVVTKCDLLPGFMDFFVHSGTEELGQAWGITIPPLPQSAALIDVFSNRFNALIKRLNKQLIWRLHQERGTFERVFIKDFPLQVEHLKETLIDVLAALTAAQNRFSLQGVYLTSANQHSVEENIIQHQPTSDSEARHELQIMHTPAMPSRSYFIRQFLLQGLHDNHARPVKLWQKRPVVYGLCASTIALTVVFLGFDIFYSKQKLIAMQGAEVSTFNIIVPPDVPRETKVGDITIIS
jgi:type VI secretion system protein ImpL